VRILSFRAIFLLHSIYALCFSAFASHAKSASPNLASISFLHILSTSSNWILRPVAIANSDPPLHPQELPDTPNTSAMIPSFADRLFPGIFALRLVIPSISQSTHVPTDAS
jgi:hypothetical protein